MPIVMFDRSILMVNGKNQTKSHKNTIMQPLVKVQKGKNQATLQFGLKSFSVLQLLVGSLL